jgi:hypothetical protein
MKGRTAPALTPAQQRQAERLAALRSGDVALVRAWAARYGVPLLGDEQTLLISYHEARAVERAMPDRVRRDSRRWLEQYYPQSVVLRGKA